MTTISNFDPAWIQHVSKTQTNPALTNVTEPRELKRNVVEYINKIIKELSNTRPKQNICHGTTLLEGYAFTLLSPDVIVSLTLDVATNEITYSAMQKHQHCNEFFNKNNSSWERDLSLIGCLKVGDLRLWKLLSKLLKVVLQNF